MVDKKKSNNRSSIEETQSRLSMQRIFLEHFNAQTVEEALTLLAKHGHEAGLIAGGVDCISLLKKRVKLPRILVNLKTIPGLAYINEDSDFLRIGPLTTIHNIETSENIRSKYPLLAQAAHSVASPQIRNMGTLGGNLCQDVWCWYYRRSPFTGRSFFCRRKGGDKCYAVAGDNRYHAILNGKTCFAVCPSDMAPALIALNASLKIAGPAANRTIPLEDLYQPLGTTLQPGEMIAEIMIPVPEQPVRQRWIKIRDRKTIDFAIASLAAAVIMDGDTVKDARIILGGVAPTPYHSIAAEKELIGKPLGQRAALAAAGAAVDGAVPLSMNRHKIQITRSLVKKVILQ